MPKKRPAVGSVRIYTASPWHILALTNELGVRPHSITLYYQALKPTARVGWTRSVRWKLWNVGLTLAPDAYNFADHIGCHTQHHHHHVFEYSRTRKDRIDCKNKKISKKRRGRAGIWTLDHVDPNYVCNHYTTRPLTTERTTKVPVIIKILELTYGWKGRCLQQSNDDPSRPLKIARMIQRSNIITLHLSTL